MKNRKPLMRACERCGLERVVKSDRRSLCMSCRPTGLRPIANWMEHASCRSESFVADWWWPEKAEPDDQAKLAMLICRYCPVRDLCLDYAVAHKERHGIWGGLMPVERAAIATQARREAI